jgi:hypothetical protein
MVIVLEAQVAVRPDGRPVAVPIPVAPVVVWVTGVIAAFRHTVGVAEAAVTVFVVLKQPQAGEEGVPIFISTQFRVVLKMSKPVAGLTIALRCEVVRRGGSSPRVVLCTSSSAEGSVVVPPSVVCAGRGAAAKAKSRDRAAGIMVCTKNGFIRIWLFLREQLAPDCSYR